MSISRSRRILIFVLLVLTATLNARADITSQTIRPSFNNEYQLIEDSSLWQWDPLDAGQHKTFYKLLVNTVSSPVTQFDASGKNPIPLVNRTSSLQIGGVWNLAEKLQVGADIGDNVVQGASGSSYSGISDLRLMAKYGLWGRAGDFGISVSPELYFPFPNTNLFLSNEVFGYGGKLLIEKSFKYFQVAANAGILRFAGATYRNIDYSVQVPLGLGFYIPMTKKFAINIEGVTNVLPGSDLFGGPGDLYGGASIFLFPGAFLTLGTSTSPIQTNGTTSLRFLVGFNLLPYTKEAEILVAAPSITVTKTIETVKKITKTRDCSPKPFLRKFMARKLTLAEKERVLKLLPYISTPDQQIATLDLGEKTGLTSEGRTYVKDSQIIMAVDISNLPKKDTVVSIDSLNLKMKVNKLLSDTYEKTDMLCFLNEKICSGDLYSSKLREKNINNDFFQGKESPNDFFMRKFRHAVGEKGKPDQILTTELDLPLAKLTENSTLGDILNLIYEKPVQGSRQNKKLIYIAVAHDVYVYKKVELDIALKIVTCNETAPETLEQTTHEEKNDGR